MDENKYSSLLFVMIPSILKYYKNGSPITKEDLDRFYNSKLYKTLEDESMKLWHFSDSTLAIMYKDELEHGDFDYPEVAA